MKVKFTYFKEGSGKYYSEGEENCPNPYFYEMLDWAQLLLREGQRPGLVDGYEFDVLVTAMDGDIEGLSNLFTRRNLNVE